MQQPICPETTPQCREADLAYQDAILQDVSRTFALTIPLLPPALCEVVGNAYLICRIADTLEDSPDLSVADKVRFSELFVDALAGRTPAHAFIDAVMPALGPGTTEAEADLLRNTDRVLRITHSFRAKDRAALERCARIMTQGMELFQEGAFTAGLRDVPHLDAYCYHVAGVVGEMLSTLFQSHSPGCAAHGADLDRNAVSFGEGLQLVNILKDTWDDKARGVCWLPRDVFERHGFDLATLSPEDHGERFQAGFGELIGITHRHLKNALDYTLTVPSNETGIRSFCLLALSLAILTLRKLNQHRDFTDGQTVKVSRRTVYLTWLGIRLFRRHDRILRWAFSLMGRGVPRP